MYKLEKKKKYGKKTPVYRRWWFSIPCFLFLLGCLAVMVGFIFLKIEYAPIVNSFDLSKLHRMEAASVVYDRNAQVVGSLFVENRSVVPYSEISPLLSKAVVAEEDNRFYEHSGVDFLGIVRAALTNYRLGRTVQGGSTVTQQLARNSFDLRERTYRRKIIEMFLAMKIEKTLSKDQIMELYLNRVYFGSGFYGAEAAARGYFGKSAKSLNANECALLAGLLKSPQGLSPWTNPEGALKTRNFVLKRMYEMGFITAAALDESLRTPLGVKPRTNPTKVSYALDFIRQQAIVALGFNRVMNEGFRIYTSLDLNLQHTAELALHNQLTDVEKMPSFPHGYQTYRQYMEQNSALEDRINRGDLSVKLPTAKYLQGAALLVENTSGGILAMVGGRNFHHSEYNRALQAHREAGTVFTPFVFLTAYDRGIFPGEPVEDISLDNRYVMVGGTEGILGEWGAENPENRYEGPMTTHYALAKGKNAATVRLGFQVGLDPVKKLAHRAGISSKLYNFSKTFLGGSEMTLAELALAYTSFPNMGNRPENLHLIERITDAAGNVVYQYRPQRVQVTSPEAAYQAHSALEDALNMTSGRGFSRLFQIKPGLVAGKTGTSYNFFDAYFVGYTSSVTCAVWVGFDQRQKIFPGAFGNILALPIGAALLNQSVQQGFPAQKWTRPKDLTAVLICKDSGLLATPTCLKHEVDSSTGKSSVLQEAYTEYATPQEIPKIMCDVHGTGIRSYVKKMEKSKWPRATASTDTSGASPVIVKTPTLIGLTDIYNSVRPPFQKAGDTNIPIQRALPPDTTASAQANEAEPPEPQIRRAEKVDPSAEETQDAPITSTQPQENTVEPQIRRAEAVNPSVPDAPAIAIPAPPSAAF